MGSSMLLSGARQAVDDDFFAIQKNFEIFGSMFESLVRQYVDPVDAERVMRRGMSAMLAELDPYTVFLDEADYINANVRQARRLGTVGLDVDLRDGRLTVLSPIDGGAAFRQGVRVGDVIVAIAGSSIDQLSERDARELLEGDPGSAVEVVIERAGEDAPKRFHLIREVIRQNPVVHSGFLEKAPSVAYVHLANFNPGSAEAVEQALKALMNERPLEGVILDLRDNQGGLLDAAVSIVQLFVPAGSPVVTTRGRKPENIATFPTTEDPILPDVPLAVLVNERSASSSEIVAGALQDLDRGIIVGSTSFGKGLAQNVIPLPFTTGLKITTSRFYLPSGRNIQALDYRLHGTRVADSLRARFTSSNGRVVRGGGGIEPDVNTNANAGPVEESLRRSGAFYHFARDWSTNGRTVPPDYSPATVDLSAFSDWLSAGEYRYRSQAREQLDALKSTLSEPSGARSATTGFEQLEELIRVGEQRAFEAEEAVLRHAVFEAVVRQLATGVATQYGALLAHDPDVGAALDLISDAAAYQQMLRP